MRESRLMGNAAERAFQDAAREAGWKASKRGWPDFVCWNEQGEMIIVEVKPSANHGLRENQAVVLRTLADHGIRVFRWSPDAGFVRIKRTDEEKPADRWNLADAEAPPE